MALRQGRQRGKYECVGNPRSVDGAEHVNQDGEGEVWRGRSDAAERGCEMQRPSWVSDGARVCRDWSRVRSGLTVESNGARSCST